MKTKGLGSRMQAPTGTYDRARLGCHGDVPLNRVMTGVDQRALDRHIVETTPLSLSVLMEAAGKAVADAVDAHAIPGARIAVVVGQGQNGGDGFVAARHLLARGHRVVTCDVAYASRRPAEAQAAREALMACGHRPCDGVSCLKDEGPFDVVVDAIFGGGFDPTRALSPALTDALMAVRCARTDGAFVISVDVPSGVSATTGAASEVAVHADLVVTFVRAKVGLVSHPGALHLDAYLVDPLGVPAEMVAAHTVNGSLYAVCDATVATLVTPLARDRHKGDGGRALIVAGSKAMPGAAVLATRAALTSGVGYVALGADSQTWPTLMSAVPEALLEPTLDRTVYERYAVTALGPGLGRRDDVDLIEAITHARALVLDADALRRLALSKEAKDALARRQDPAILTPHVGEAQALGDYEASDRVASARTLARTYGAIVVLKGMASVVAYPDGTACIITTGNPGLAKGGSGDVLTGLIAGLIATGLSPFEAAVAGAHLHGTAADRIAQTQGERAVTPSAVIRSLSEAMAEAARRPRT